MDALVILYGTPLPGACLVRRGEVSGVRFESEYLEEADWPRIFPDNAVGSLLRDAGIGAHELDNIVICGKPFSVLEKLLNTHMFFFPRYFGAFVKDFTDLFGEKLRVRTCLKKKTGFSGDTLFFDPMDILASARAAFLDDGDAAVVSLGGHAGARSLGVYRKAGGRIVLEKELNYPSDLSAICASPGGGGAFVPAEDAVRVERGGSFCFNSRYFVYTGGKTAPAPGYRIERGGAEELLFSVMSGILAPAAPPDGRVMFVSDHGVPENICSRLSGVIKGLSFNNVDPADILKESAAHYIKLSLKG